MREIGPTAGREIGLYFSLPSIAIGTSERMGTEFVRPNSYKTLLWENLLPNKAYFHR
jgi:hypothetical protein